MSNFIYEPDTTHSSIKVFLKPTTPYIISLEAPIALFWKIKEKLRLRFPRSGKSFIFDDEITLKTFLELHWEDYYRG